MELKKTFEAVKKASKSLATLSDKQRNEVLQAVANAIILNKERILKAKWTLRILFTTGFN